MADLIDRQAAIDAFWKLDAEIRPSAINAIIDMIRTLPSAETPKRTGTSTQNVLNDDFISRKAAIDVLHDYFDGALETDTICPKDIYNLFEIIPSAQPEIIRCKDCKHQPFDGEDTQGLGVEFPDNRCPCQCDDEWYNWRPNNEWFVLMQKGERMRLIDADEYEKRIKPYDTEDDMDKALYNFAHYHLATTPTAQLEPFKERERMNVQESCENHAEITGRPRDTIYRQAAIDAAKKLLDYYGTNDMSKEFADHTAERFMNRVPAAQPERKTGKWIEKDDGWDGVYYECSVCGEPYTLIDGLPSDNKYNYCPNCGARMIQEGENNE